MDQPINRSQDDRSETLGDQAGDDSRDLQGLGRIGSVEGEVEASSRVERKIAKARVALLAETDPEEKRRLLKKIKKMRSRAEGPRATASGLSIPREATRIRHKWTK